MSEDVTPYGGNESVYQQRANEMRELMAELGLTQRETAKELEVDDRTLRYWAAAQNRPPKMMIMALRYLVSIKGARRDDAAAGSMRAGDEQPNVVHKAFRVADDDGQ